MTMSEERSTQFIESNFGGVASKVLGELVIMKDAVSNSFLSDHSF